MRWRDRGRGGLEEAGRRRDASSTMDGFRPFMAQCCNPCGPRGGEGVLEAVWGRAGTPITVAAGAEGVRMIACDGGGEGRLLALEGQLRMDPTTPDQPSHLVPQSSGTLVYLEI